jgi:hypothetical protein
MVDDFLILEDSDWDVMNAFYYFGGRVSSDGTEMTRLEKLLRPDVSIDRLIYSSLSKSDTLSVKINEEMLGY